MSWAPPPPQYQPAQQQQQQQQQQQRFGYEPPQHAAHHSHHNPHQQPQFYPTPVHVGPGASPRAAGGVEMTPVGFGGGAAAEMGAVDGVPLYDTKNPVLDARFQVAGYQDVWATVLFMCQLLACVIVGSINLAANKLVVTGTSPTGKSLIVQFIEGAAVGLGISCGMTVILLLLLRAFAREFIWIANIFIICVFLAIGVLGIVFNLVIVAIIGFVLAAVTGAWLYCVRSRIPFSALLLETSTNCVMRFYGAIVFAFVSLTLAIAYFVFWTLMMVPTMNDLNSTGTNIRVGTGGAWIAFAFLVMLYWTQQVCQNVVHVTTSGAVATWYFVGDAEMPSNPSAASFKRAMTTSFGSICFGSLIVAVLKVIEFMARAAANNNRNSFAACIAYCIIQCIERMMEYFNQYAFSHVAIYGCSYIEAAKMTWEFMKRSLFAAIINDVLVDRVIIMVSWIQAIVAGVAVYFIFGQNIIACIGAVLMALIVAGVVFNTVASGVITMMVCVAESLDVFYAKHADLANKMTHAMNAMQEGCCA